MNWIDIIRTLIEWATVLNNLHNELSALIAKMMTFMVVPSFLVLKTDTVAHNLGAVVGFTQAVMVLIMVIIAIVTMWPSSRTGRQIGQVFTSIWGMAFFIVGFYPAINLVQLGLSILRDFILYLMDVEQDKLAATINNIATTPLDPAIRVTQLLLMIVLGFLLLALQVFLAGALIALVFLFPLALVLRPLGGFWDTMFHVLLSGIPTILLSPFFMTVCVLSPIVVGKYVPLGDTAIAQLLVVFVAYLAAIFVPVVLWQLAYRKSVDVHGKIESTIRNKVDIGSMPKPSWDDAQHAGRSAAESPIKALVGSVAAGTIAATAASGGDGQDIRNSFKHIVADGVAAGATVSGHPWVGAAIQGVDSLSRATESRQRAAKAEARAAEEAAQAAETPPLPQMFTTGHETPAHMSSRKE